MGERFSPIRIETPRALLEHHYELGLYCRACDRWTVADLQQLIESGRGDRPVARMRLVCRVCRATMSAQVRPPVPKR